MNKYRLDEQELEKIRARDSECVYYHKKMIKPNINSDKKDWSTIEHFNHLSPWNNISTVAICCDSYNSSRGNKLLHQWFKTQYCKNKNINQMTVSACVKYYLKATANS